MPPWLGNAARLFQSNDVSGGLLDHTVVIQLQMTNNRRFSYAGSACKDESLEWSRSYLVLLNLRK